MAGRGLCLFLFLFFFPFCYFHLLSSTHSHLCPRRAEDEMVVVGGGWVVAGKGKGRMQIFFFFSFRVTTAARTRSDEMCNDGLESAVHRQRTVAAIYHIHNIVRT